MNNSTVINNAPWVTAFGTVCTAVSFFVGLPLSLALNFVALVAISASLGALLTHRPG